MDLTAQNLPTVSIGIPTYNRPEGLSRTLDCITRQTYRNLQIIVSDNASPNDETEKAARAFMATDPRLRYHRQRENIGVVRNFKFVLEQATGKYFMWAADDDEWDARFVEVCVALLEKGVVSAMTGFNTLFRFSGIRRNNVLPNFSPDLSFGRNAFCFLRQPTPSLFYGLHRREALRFFTEEHQWFDYYDCYFVLRLLMQGSIALSPEVLYTAGIDAPVYQLKLADRKAGLKLMPFLRAANHLTASVRLSVSDSICLKMGLVYFGIRGYLWYVTLLARRTLSGIIKRQIGSQHES